MKVSITGGSTHIQRKRRYSCVVVPPIRKELACGVVGIGAMAHSDEISRTVKELMR